MQLHSADRKVIGHSERSRRGWCHGFDNGRGLCNNSHAYNHCQINVFEIARAILSSVNVTQSTYFFGEHIFAMFVFVRIVDEYKLHNN